MLNHVNTNGKTLKNHLLNFTEPEIRKYMYQLLAALAEVHKVGVMHRDIKGDNILIDADTNQLHLVDFGLSEFYQPDLLYNMRVASRYNKGPELLTKQVLDGI